MVKNLPASAGDTRDEGLFPGSGKIPWRRKWEPTPVSCLENHTERGAWQAAVYRVAQSQT